MIKIHRSSLFCKICFGFFLTFDFYFHELLTKKFSKFNFETRKAIFKWKLKSDEIVLKNS